MIDTQLHKHVEHARSTHTRKTDSEQQAASSFLFESLLSACACG